MESRRIAEPRVGLLGPRRTRQGLGPFFAVHLEESGARVVAFVSRRASIEAASHDLGRRLGHPVRGYDGIEAMLEKEALDALVIASPPATHEPALQLARDAHLHVLCEKPVLGPERGSAARVRELVAAFHRRKLWFRVNVQWPWTLPAYFELFPQLRGHEFGRFWMLLSPSRRGKSQIVDSLPHPLSMLHALCPSEHPELAEPVIRVAGEDALQHEVTFVYRAAGRAIACRIELVHGPAPPRRAGYGLDGHRAMRRIEPEYRMFFDGDGRSVRVADPLRSLVRDFVAALQTGASPEFAFSAASQARMLEQLVDEYPGGRG